MIRTEAPFRDQRPGRASKVQSVREQSRAQHSSPGTAGNNLVLRDTPKGETERASASVAAGCNRATVGPYLGRYSVPIPVKVDISWQKPAEQSLSKPRQNRWSTTEASVEVFSGSEVAAQIAQLGSDRRRDQRPAWRFLRFSTRTHTD
ncbi:hypothetical protein F442_02217 [Phytophthora nicotianae P10297]|uniref:Uncharacterized protein n=3 Tax=Phytophthora nicotianae TaxID=4792 RepID=W3A0V5_PHYNI|nr:hypothetical protein L917_02061 [Phytophthora nicotianae]ETO83767.1 hypothetical protein F444_02267 [Phytophthora nicotianae P1976]ETP52831.1 hypothetical protein F442_02217 [Phytophthora nicotianae P10297]